MDLPLRLLVSAVVVGLTIPAVLGGLNAYEAEAASARAVGTIDAVVRVAQRFYVSGGGSEDVRVDLRGGIAVRVEGISIGDRIGGPHATLAAYRITGRPIVFLRSDPAVPMAGDGAPLSLGPGVHAVRVSYDGAGPVRLVVP